MRRVAIVGSGISGLLTAHGLRRAGYEVTLYSDRSPDDWLVRSKPTGIAGRFDLALAYERELGLAHWEDACAKVEGVHLTFSPAPGNRLLTLAGRLAKPGMAIDVRLQSHRWMLDLEALGGRVIIESVSAARLDAIAAENDLTIVATGKAELTRAFERDDARSGYAKPQRQLAMMCVHHARLGFDGVPFIPVKFNLFGTEGEAFWVPFHHVTLGQSWALLFEAKEGRAFDVFRDAKDGAEVVARAKELIRTLIPWDYAWAKDMELSDPNGWLVGAITPTVRRPVAKLPSGRVVTGVGDTLMLFDPIAGQGANNGTKMAKHLVQAVLTRGDAPFDEAWMTSTFEAFWEDQGRPSYAFNNLLLEPITDAGKELLIAQYGSDGSRDDAPQKIADAFAANFIDPREVTHLMTDVVATKAFIAQTTGQSWLRRAIAGRLGIGRAQVRQKLGLAPNHPLASS